MSKLRGLFPLICCLAAAAVQGQQTDVDRLEFSGVYRPQGLAVQPCGGNEWTKRSFETDLWCFGSEEGYPFSEQGREAWKAYSPIDDPILGCIESFPRSAMRGRTMRITLGEQTTEIAYWFNQQWHRRSVHMNGTPPSADTAHTDWGYSTGRWLGDTLVVETTHTNGGPMYNDHKPNSPAAHFSERFWRAPDGQNLMMDVALDDPSYYTKPFILNRQEWVWSPNRQLNQTECIPSLMWTGLDEEQD